MYPSSFLPHLSNPISPFPYNTTTKTPIQLNSLPPKGRNIQCESSSPSSSSKIKAPTAPWMNEPLYVKPHEILQFTKRRPKKHPPFGEIEEHPDKALTEKVGGGRGRIAMKKIFKGIEKLRETHELEHTPETLESVKFKFGPRDLCADSEFGGNAEFDISHLLGTEKGTNSKKLPWEKEDEMVIRWVVKERVVTIAEMSLDGVLLEKLRGEAAMMKKWVKVKKAGVTQGVVDQVRFIWRNGELALLKFDVPLCRNMDRAREIVEMKTGGMVVWRNKDFLAVYRGCNYKAGAEFDSSAMNVGRASYGRSEVDEITDQEDGKLESLHRMSLYEREADRLLEGLGPRFVDWWMQKPLPVDADLLPEIVPGLTTPLRRYPPFTRAKLTSAELTYLRKLARPLPTHFVLGRNRKLQGLAAAIIKLWEKCHIAKIALKWGVPNTDNEQMAFELKSLTGGILLLRNKFLIILYRGKDFVPPEVAKVVAERETELTRCQFLEDAARLKASENFSVTDGHLPKPETIGTLSEFQNILIECGKPEKERNEVEVQLEGELERMEKELKNQEWKLSLLKKKIEKSTKILKKLNSSSAFSDQNPDLEIISEEDRECLRNMALKINSSLVLGRRGIYDGVIEGMHQHWKHREVVKVITMQKKFSQIIYTAKHLEAESGGILVSIDKLKEGHAIIVYRGKNFKRPKIATQNLLNRREAFSRSIEAQRLGSLNFFAHQREQAIRDLKCKLGELKEVLSAEVDKPHRFI